MIYTLKNLLCRLGIHFWRRSNHKIFVARHKQEVYECFCGRIVATFFGEEKTFNIWGRKNDTGIEFD